MQNGPKPLCIATKLARGTYRPDRDADVIEIVASDDPPQIPEYLTPEAEIVWEGEIGRIIAAGGSEADSALVGRYCSLESMVRQAFATGTPPPATYLAELRRHAELLGIAGAKSRTIRPGASTANPFIRNGRKPEGGK